MVVGDAVYEMASRSGKTLAQVASELGHARNYLAVLRRQGTMRVDTLADVAGACGHVVTLVPQSDVPAGAITIDNTDKDM